MFSRCITPDDYPGPEHVRQKIANDAETAITGDIVLSPAGVGVTDFFFDPAKGNEKAFADWLKRNFPQGHDFLAQPAQGPRPWHHPQSDRAERGVRGQAGQSYRLGQGTGEDGVPHRLLRTAT